MEKKRKKVFLTGATGVMGMAALKEFAKNRSEYQLIVLARDTTRNRKKLKPYIAKGLEVIWGDLLDEKKLRAGIENADVVLHLGGMVSPMAEHYPAKTLKVNVGSMKLIADIIKDIEAKDTDRVIKTVYIGSVSQYGSHLPPHHWGKAGDPLRAAVYDAYAVSKILAERALVEAGLRHWVSLRQTSILHGGLFMKANDPVTFHVPINGVLEWVTTEDSARLLVKVSGEDPGSALWGNYYNVGGGEKFRLTNMEFERGILKAIGCPAPEKIFEPNWFATDNFHGIWFEDSDKLDEMLHYREEDDFNSALERIGKGLPFYFKFTPLAPAFIIKKVMKEIACKPDLGPLHWLKQQDTGRIEACWGSLEEYRKIPGWKELKYPMLDRKTPVNEIYNSDKEKEKGNIRKKLSTLLYKEKCSRGHEYYMSEALKAGGHGCPECLFIDSKVEKPEF